MAVTKISCRKSGLRQLIRYVLNGDKTEEQIFTHHINCDPGYEYEQMQLTKERLGKTEGRQCYHIIQSFAHGEITPEEALEIATQFAGEHLPGYEVVIGTHVDKAHIHSHIVFNSVNALTGRMYRSNYPKIKALSDRLCRAHGLSVVERSETPKAVSYGEWLRQQRGLPTYRTMLKEDLDAAIHDAVDYGHFLVLMERLGYEIKHGKYLGFRLWGQKNFLYPHRQGPRYTEECIRAAISGSLNHYIETGELPPRRIYAYTPYQPHQKYSGILGLYHHYLYLLQSLEGREVPAKSRHNRAEVMKFEEYREKFAFLREHKLTSKIDLHTFELQANSELEQLMKQRTILNVQKKRRKPLYQALAEEAALIHADPERYRAAVALLDDCPETREDLTKEQIQRYNQLSAINRQIREKRRQLKLCRDISAEVPGLERELASQEREAIQYELYR